MAPSVEYARRTVIGTKHPFEIVSKAPVLFNRKRQKPVKPRTRQEQPITEEQAELVEALKSLGLTVGGEEVQTALRELYPNGWTGIDQGEVVRRVFLKLREGK